MAEQLFSDKEVISHGLQMTKKYWSTILILVVIYAALNGVNVGLQNFAGSSTLIRSEIGEIYKDTAEGDRFYQYLQDTGYVNQYGRVQDKLQQVKNESGLELASDFESKRYRIYSFLEKYRYRLPFAKPIFFGISLIFWIVNMLMFIGFIKAYLMMARDEEPPISELFSNWRLLIPYLLGSICYGLVIMGGFILLIVPGIILMIMFQFWSYVMIDKGLGPIQALKRSQVITKGSRGKLAVLGLLLMLLNIGGLLCLVIGLFFTLSITSIAMANVYDILENSHA